MASKSLSADGIRSPLDLSQRIRRGAGVRQHHRLRTDRGKAIRIDGHAAGYELLDEVIADPARRHGAVIEVVNADAWRTPLDVVIVSHRPEREFLTALLGDGAAAGVDAWIKSRDTGFYSIPYTVVKGDLTLYVGFNPDWILRRGEEVLVVETKDDNSVTAENAAKLAGAMAWCDQLNRLLEAEGSAVRYRFYFLAAADIAAFFERLVAGTHAAHWPGLQHDLGANAAS
jgi:type III restriction enzyme